MALAIDTDPDTDPEDTPFPELNAIRCRMGQKPAQAFAPPAILHSHKTGAGRGTRWAGGVAHTPLDVKKAICGLIFVERWVKGEHCRGEWHRPLSADVPEKRPSRFLLRKLVHLDSEVGVPYNRSFVMTRAHAPRMAANTFLLR